MRPSWDEYFIQMIHVVSTRSTCNRGRTGCIITQDRRIVATGYAGSPPGLPHCDDVGHEIRATIDEDGVARDHCVRTIHAEQNAICQAARSGIPLAGGSIYVGMEPCRVCAQLIIAVGIKRVVAEYRYHAGADTRALLEAASVPLIVLNDTERQYELAET
jgi:dCMP deaminase